MVGLMLLGGTGWAGEPPESALQALVGRLAPALSMESARRQTLTGSVEVVRADGVAPRLAGRRLMLAFQAPDRFRVGGNLGAGWVEVGRLGRNLWLWDSPRRRVVAARPAAGAGPSSVELDGLGLPFLEQGPTAMAAALDLRELGPNRWNQVLCEGLSIRPREGTAALLGWAAFEGRVWWPRGGGLPVRVEWSIPDEKTRLSLQMHQLRLVPAWADSRWQLEVPRGTRVEWTSLGAFTREVPAGLRESLEGWAIPEAPMAPSPAGGR